MANKYIFDQESLSYKKVPLLTPVLNIIYIIAGSLILFAIVYSIITSSSVSPQESRLKRENKILLLKYRELNIKLDHTHKLLTELQHRDDNIYRMIFGENPLPRTMREAGAGGTDNYKELAGLKNSELLIHSSQKLDVLERQMRIQYGSYTEILNLIRKRENYVACVPAIQPIANNDLLHAPYGYGPRIDPVYKTPAFHHGMDFSAHTGTPIYATADGTIIRADAYSKGYGKHVRIDHGFGYKTLYAHMSKLVVKKGQTVKRGEIIGEVGSTGKSVGPHVHYEVRINDIPVNPINYYFNDLTPEQYTKLTLLASRGKKCLD